MAGEIVYVDALPYFDQGYDEPGVREAALALVDEETKRYRPTKNYLEHLGQPKFDAFETDVMRTEFERLQARLPMDMLSMKRYELPQPSAGRMNDVAAWQECVDNAHSQLEHQTLRFAVYASSAKTKAIVVPKIMNLELISAYGTEAWKLSNNVLLRMLESARKQLVDLKKQIQEINMQRKTEQTSAGSKLKVLEESWVGLVSKNYEIERACMELESDVHDLEHKAKKLKK